MSEPAEVADATPETRARPGRLWLALACAAALIGCTTEPGPSDGRSAAPGSAASSGPTLGPTNAPPVSEAFGILPGTPPSDLDAGITCSGTMDAADPVAVVQLAGTADELGPLVVLDFADPAAPRTVCTFSGLGWGSVEFVDARHLVASSPTDAQGLYVVVDVPDVRYRWIQLPISEGSQGSDLVAMSPALDELVWVDRQPAGVASDKVHVTTTGGDLVVAELRDTNGGRCGDSDDSDDGAYTRSGTLAYVMNRPDPSDASLIVLDGESVAYSLTVPKADWPAGGGPAMAVWSPTTDTLYYRNGADSWSWTADAGAKRFLPGVKWYRPTISPDGTYLAYTVLDAKGLPDVYLVDLANPGDPMHVGTGHANLPAFLGSDQLWYVAMQYTPGCEGADIQTPMVYSLTDASETPSPIDSIVATWPATSSNH